VKKLFLLPLVCLLGVSSPGQTSYFNQGFLRQPDAATDRAYLGITNGSGGSGTVTSFSSGNLSPLFTTSVVNPTTTPALSYTLSSQAANLVFAGPSLGGAAAPTFRSLVTGDLPDISALVRADVSATAPILYNSGTGVFSMHVADASHDGYLSSSDWSTFNGKGNGTLVSITNADSAATPPDISLIATSNAPIPSLKGLAGGTGISLVDNGNSITINSSSASAGIDIPMTTIAPFSNGTNFYVDFAWQAQVLQATGSIAFNYSTNWGLSSTSRVANVYIPPTNYLRFVSFMNVATNWHMQPLIYSIPPFRGARITAQLFGPGDTNITISPLIDSVNAQLSQVFNLSSITTATNVFWMDASRGTYQDSNFTVPADDNKTLRGWRDQSGFGNDATNSTAPDNSLLVHNAMTGPFNVPCIEEYPGGTSAGSVWLKTKTISSLAHPIYVFVMGYSVVAGNNQTIDSLTGGTTRNLCDFVFGGNCTIASQNASSFTANNTLPPQWALFTFVFNGASSAIRTNAVNAATGTLTAVVPTGFTFGSDINGTLPTGRTFISELQIWRGPLTTADLGNIETNYFRAKYRNW
jgi:hypothetical protein